MTPSHKSPPACPNGFAPGRGVNISHWLSQRDEDTPKPADYFSEIDVGFLRSCGFQHIRLPVDEPILWDADGRRRKAEWDRMFAALDWCHRHGLRAVVDLHIIRAHHFNARNQGRENPLWTSREAQDHLAGLWVELSTALESHPVDAVAYEIMNEPVAPDAELWNTLLNKVHGTIRGREPRRTIIIGSNLWQKTRTVPQLRLPEGDPNLMVSFHYYEPGMVTHYGTHWTALKEYNGPVRYPGVPFPEEAIPDPLSPELKALLEEGNRHYDREVIREEIAVAVAFARARGLPAYCGEWGCYRFTDKAMRLRWYRDVLGVLDECGTAWAIWDYKGGFRIVDPESKSTETELIRLLTKAGG